MISSFSKYCPPFPSPFFIASTDFFRLYIFSPFLHLNSPNIFPSPIDSLFFRLHSSFPLRTRIQISWKIKQNLFTAYLVKFLYIFQSLWVKIFLNVLQQNFGARYFCIFSTKVRQNILDNFKIGGRYISILMHKFKNLNSLRQLGHHVQTSLGMSLSTDYAVFLHFSKCL